MQDDHPVTGTTTGSPQTASARENWQPELGQDYITATRAAREVRRQRAARAAAAVVGLAHQIARGEVRSDSIGPRLTQEEIAWSVRGEPRTRATFAAPHPGDFKGGLPAPREFPG